MNQCKCETCNWWFRAGEVSQQCPCEHPKVLVGEEYAKTDIPVDGMGAIGGEPCAGPELLTGALFGCIHWKEREEGTQP